jgi:hypothetical protein
LADGLSRTRLRGNNPETKFNIPEKLAKENGIIRVSVAVSRSTEHTFRGFQDPAMQRTSIGLVSVLLPLLLIAASAAQSEAKTVATKVLVTRSERCSRLSHQVDEAIEKHAKARQVTEAKALQRKANRFCAEKKQAQGIRTLANALKVLGVAPVDPNQ